MTNLLFIAYEFPPLNRGGIYRSAKFVKYLRQFDINPIVLTLEKESYKNVFDNFQTDNTLEKEIPSDIEIVRTPANDIVKNYKGKIRSFISNFFSIYPQEGKAWKDFFNKKADEIIEKHKPKAIFVTAPPVSVIDLAVKLSEKHNLPLIVDFRDAWSQWVTSPYATYFHYKLTLKKERYFLEKASSIIATSDQTIADFKRLHSNIDKDKFHLITNGYDEEIKNWNLDISRKNEDILKIGYVGSFYYSPNDRKQMFMKWWQKRPNRMFQYTPRKEDWLYRSPYFFFKTLKYLFEKEPELKNKIQIHFAGNKPDWIEEMVKENDLENNCIFLGRISWEASIKFQKGCDALLVTSSKVVGGQDYSIAGKTFEYIGLQKPILGFTAEGAQKRIIEKTGLAIVCNPDDLENSAKKISDFYHKKIKFNPNIEFLKKLHRKELTAKLSDIIKEI